MTQRIYDSKRAEIVEFKPLTAGKVGMYVCGPTVQSSPHVGHLRSALVYDQVRRWLAASGFDVTLIRNVTDIDDKILDNAAEAQRNGSSEHWWALAYRVEREFTAAYDALGILPPTYEPRATANIDPMIRIIQMLIERGHAYVSTDGDSSVYFDTRSWPSYGSLTNQSLDNMEEAADSEPLGKRDPRDFALWKAHREHEPLSASWESPWGRGRPGWHIECSAMSTQYLGEQFDIHGGGLDLRFPHHENELAQSTAAGHGFAQYWMHNGLVHTSGQKMSKSLGNSLFASDLLSSARPLVVRYFLGSAHYRSVLDMHETALAEAEAAFSRIETFLDRAARDMGEDAPNNQRSELRRSLPEAFIAAMEDDFAIPQALAVLHETVRAGNAALDAGERDRAAVAVREVTAMLDVLGLNPADETWQRSAEDPSHRALDSLVSALLVARSEARERKDFETSDLLRDQLSAAGILLEDSPTGTHWSIDE